MLRNLDAHRIFNRPICNLQLLRAAKGAWIVLWVCVALCAGAVKRVVTDVPRCAQVKARLGDAGFATVRAKVMAQQEVFVQQMYEMHRVATRQRHLQMACERPNALRAEIALQVPPLHLTAGVFILIVPSESVWLLGYNGLLCLLAIFRTQPASVVQVCSWQRVPM